MNGTYVMELMAANIIEWNIIHNFVRRATLNKYAFWVVVVVLRVYLNSEFIREV